MRRCQRSESFTILRKAWTTRVSTDSPQSSAAKWNDHLWHAWHCRPSFHWTESDITVKSLLTTIFKSKVSACGESHLCVKSGNCQLNASRGTRESALSNTATQAPTNDYWKYHLETNSLRKTHLRGTSSVWPGWKCNEIVSWPSSSVLQVSGEGKTVSFAGAHRFTTLFSGQDIFILFHLFLRVITTTTDAMDAKLTQTDQQAKENAGRKGEQLIRYESFHEKQHFSYLFDVIYWLAKHKTSFPVHQDHLWN